MKETYINFEKRVTLNFNLGAQNKELRLYNWLLAYYEEIFWEIEMHETGIRGVQVTNDEITFCGDNGILILERARISTI